MSAMGAGKAVNLTDEKITTLDIFCLIHITCTGLIAILVIVSYIWRRCELYKINKDNNRKLKTDKEEDDYACVKYW